MSETKIEQKLLKTKDRVRFLLEKYPESRNSDFYLIILYIRKFVPELSRYIDYIPYNTIKKYEGLLETIRRTRQKIQSENPDLMPTDPDVLRKRKKLAETYRRVLPRI